ncbi:MAG TPA: histidinol-phosphate transaminase [Burkholderiales bacterium]|nr:histidinol-phosphate transaminase [Burkholderiales bacterium]
MNPAELVRPEVLALSAYHVPPAEGMVKLDAMENPYPLPETLRRELAEALSRVELNRYPDPSGAKLRELLRRKMKVPAGFEVMLGNGSDELLQIAVLALARPGAAMMFPAPTFVMYSMYGTLAGMKVHAVPLREDFSFDARAFIARMSAERPALVFIAYPNNPSGVLYPEEDVAAVVRAAPGAVVLDEAYHAFAGKSFMHRLAEFPNLLVLRTVSKLGLAGIRLGYLAGSPAWIEQLNKVRSPYNVNVLTQTAACFLLERLEVLEEQAARIREERGRLARALAALPGVHVFPSEANFILARVPGADRVHAALLARKVLVKNLNSPATRECLRVTVGTPEENRILLDALRECLQK